MPTSEYQYYEFRAVDRPLSARQMDELRRYSSRARITARSFVNVYNYGDFRGDPDKLIDKYFDAFLYLANWGTRWLMLRIPRKLLSPELAAAFTGGDCFCSRHRGDHVVLSFRSDDEGDGEWAEGARCGTPQNAPGSTEGSWSRLGFGRLWPFR